MITKEKLLKDLASIRDMIDCEEANEYISFHAWSLVDCAIAELEGDIDAIMVKINEEELEDL